MSENKRKGDLLEDLVAMLHDVEGVDVATRASVPVLDPRSSTTREIDVLLTSSCAGYPVRIAIECKNLSTPVDIEVVDSFVGKLEQVGIPPSHGVIVSSQGYTQPAQERAHASGLRLLAFEGLTANHLSQVVHDAFHSVVYVTCTWKQMSHFSVLPSDAATGPAGAIDIRCERQCDEPREHWATRAAWIAWAGGGIPLRLGEHIAVVREPATAQVGSDMIVVDLFVHGHVFTVPGGVRISALKNVITDLVERQRLDASFDASKISVRRITSEAALQQHVRTGALHVVRGRVRVPRLELPAMWYPPSQEAIERLASLRARGEVPTFERIEGLDIRRAWDAHVQRGALPESLSD